MRSLRVQLLFSHLALVALMVVMMVGAVANFLHLGRSIDRIFRNNYTSVIAAQGMREALERIDSANAYYLAGQAGLARRQYTLYRDRFASAHHTEATNITEPGEKAIADDIGNVLWPRYRSGTERLLFASPPMAPASARAYYFGVLQPQFEQLKARAQDIQALNQEAILRADRRAKSEAQRASRVGIAMTAGALVLALFFALRMIGSSLLPLQEFARQAEEIGAGHLTRRIDLHRGDEVGALATSFNRMAERLNDARKREAERLHRAERMSDQALDSLYDPVIVTDAGGRVVHLNPAAEGLFGSAAQAIGRSVHDVADDSRIARAVESAIHRKHAVAEEGEAAFVTLAAEGSERTYRLRATPMQDSDESLLGAVAVLEDVTHLRQLDRLKTEFISVASHELRTPVTSLQLSVQLMQEGSAGPLSDEQRVLVAAQREDLDRLQRVMGDLLDLARLEAGVVPPRFEIVPAGELIDSAFDTVLPGAEAAEVHMTHRAEDGLPPVRADRAQVVRVLVNLLGNAVRHTPRGGKVGVHARRRGSMVAFEVADTGSGIPPEYLPRVFERFVQVPGATRGGAGLGLSIARTIVKAHGGDIWAESVTGQGSTFTFTLPVAAPTAEGSR